MSAAIILDQRHSVYTNLDVVSGRVVVRTVKPLNIGVITIKLEGESRTRLIPAPTADNTRPRPELEFHKILYQAQALFPPPDVRARADGRSTFTLPPGEHTYPFNFKIPFNATCAVDKHASPAISLAGASVEIARPATYHLRRPLPPTLRGFPGEAEIRYYLKATINRPGFLKENIRSIHAFNFCPIEPPKPSGDGSETFARRRHQFNVPYAHPGGGDLKGKRSMFSLKPSSSEDIKSTPTSTQAPAISVETRLPQPAILTNNQDVPLRIIVTSLNEQVENLTLSSLQLDLAYYTHVRAHNVVRVESGSTVLLSKSNISLPLNFDVASGAAEVPRELWYGLSVPPSLPPTFEICNISRNYEVIVRIGIRYSKGNENPQYTTFDLRQPVQLYSGISPPPELLATLERPPPLPARRPSEKPPSSIPPSPFAPSPYPSPLPGQKTDATNLSASIPGSFPSSSGAPPGAAPAYTPASSGPTMMNAEVYSDAPPSYEDAVADRLPEVQGRREGYVPAQAQGEDMSLPTDEKRGWH